MKRIFIELLQTAKKQILPGRRTRIWTAYTRNGKVVVIDGDRVVKVVDPKKGGYAK